MSITYEQFGKNLKTYRKNKNYSTVQLAKQLEVSQGLINNIENANNDVFRLTLLNKLSDVLDISIPKLLDIKPIDVHQINISKQEICATIGILDEIPKEKMEQIDHYLYLLCLHFLTTIFQYSCDDEKIKIISEHVIMQLKLLQELHSPTSDIPI